MKTRLFLRSLPFGHLLLVATLLASGIVVWLGVRNLNQSRRSVIRYAEGQSQNLAQALDQSVSATFQRIDHTLITVAREMARDLSARHRDPARLRAFLEQEQELLPEAMAILVTDADGRTILDSSGGKPLDDIRGLPCFAVLRDQPGAGLHVTRPIRSSATGRWVITSARAYLRPDGRFGGLVVAPMPLERLQEALSRFTMGNRALLTLRDTEGGFVTRHPWIGYGATLVVGDRTFSPELRAILASGVTEQIYTAYSPFDRARRTFAFRQLRGLPLVALASLSEEDYLAQWRRDRGLTLVLLGGFLLGAWTLAGLLWRSWRTHERDARALRESGELLSLFIHHSPIYTYLKEVSSGSSRVLHASENFQRMIGIPGSQMVGRTMEELFPPGMAQRIAADDWEVVSRGQVLELAEELDGRSYTTVKFPILQGGRTLLAGFTIDITERKRAEEEQRQLQALLMQAQKMESLGSLAGGVAHDMNNVLGAILGLATASLEGLPEDSPVGPAFATIIKAAERGGGMVKSLLSFARHNPAEERELDLNGILREEVHLLEHTTLAKVRLVMDLAPDLRPVHGDASALAHAILNLCVNAVDAMADNGVLTLRSRNLEPDQVEVVVEDTGCGMSPDVLARAMDPFFTTKEEGRGTGLGLAMVYSTLKAHGGRMEIHSESGRGTIVRLLFPAREPAPQAPAPAAAAPGPSARGLKVLLVDDDALIQESLQALLAALGHAPTEARSGEHALAILASGLHPDVVILDMNMPGLGGEGTLPRLRELDPGVPVLLSTGRADQDALDLAQAHTNVTLLAKPFTLAELRRRLEALRRT